MKKRTQVGVQAIYEQVREDMQVKELGEQFLFAYMPTSYDPHEVFLSPL